MATLRGTVGFLGFGNMGEAVAEGLLRMGVASTQHTSVYDPAPGRAAHAQHLGLTVQKSASALAAKSDIILLAVKPQTMGEALEELRPHLKPKTLLISVAAGITIEYMQKKLQGDWPILRVMPNTPALVSAGASAIAHSALCNEEHIAAGQAIFEAIGLVVFVDEEDLHAVTALSGSGPAYFFQIVECLEEAAVQQGLDREMARKLAAQTLYGAGMLLWSTGEAASELRKRVTSKGGTTEAALHAFDEAGLNAAIAAGFSAASARSKELGELLD